jgi:AsmA protein
MKILRAVAIAIGVIVVILIALPFFINVNTFKPKVESAATTALGRKTEVGNLSLSILTGSVSADNISIADDPAFNKSPFLTAKSVKIGVELLPLIFSKELRVTGVTIEEPSIALVSNTKGAWNYSTIGASAPKTSEKPGTTAPGEFSVAEFRVSDGKLLIGKVASPAKPLIIEKVNLDVKNFSTTSQFPFTLSAALPSGGDLKLDGKAGPITAAQTPVDVNVKVSKLDLATIGADPSLGLAGTGALNGVLQSDGKIAKVNGTVTADNLKMAPKGSPAPHPVQVKFATNYDLKGQAGNLSAGDITYGQAVVHLTGKYATEGEATVLNMKLDGQALPVDEVESLLPALGVTLPSGSGLKGGTISTALTLVGPSNKLVITGPIKIENTSLTGFDAGSKLSALSAFTGKTASSKDTAIQNASTDVRMAPEGTKADNINLTVPSIGVVTGSGTVSPTGALDFHMVAKLTGGTGGVTQLAGLGGGVGGGGIPFMIQGTTSNPTFLPDVKGMATGAMKEVLGGKGNVPGASAAGKLEGLLKKKP